MYTKQFSPRRPVFRFTDLEVYQKTMEGSVVIVGRLLPKLKTLKYPYAEALANLATDLPLWIGEAHSRRFGNHEYALGLLEKVMAGCNRLITYLDQIRGLYGNKLGQDLLDEVVKKYLDARGKIFRLAKAWQKFEPPVK